MKSFEYFDHTADIGIAAFGPTLAEAFGAAATGLFHILADMGNVREETSIKVTVEGEDLEDLLVTWLNELLFVFDVEHLLLRSFDISLMDETALQAVCHGEHFEPDRHHLKQGIKAATHHMVRVARTDNGYSIRVIIDV